MPSSQLCRHYVTNSSRAVGAGEKELGSQDTQFKREGYFEYSFSTFISLLNLHRDLPVYGGIFGIGKLYGSRGLGIIISMANWHIPINAKYMHAILHQICTINWPVIMIEMQQIVGGPVWSRSKEILVQHFPRYRYILPLSAA